MEWFISIAKRLLNGGEKVSVMEYLKTEIKPDIEGLRSDHQRLGEKVAALPTRDEMDTRLDRLHKRIDTKQDK